MEPGQKFGVGEMPVWGQQVSVNDLPRSHEFLAKLKINKSVSLDMIIEWKNFKMQQSGFGHGPRAHGARGLKIWNVEETHTEP